MNFARRLFALILLTAFAVFGAAAKCIENDSVYVDADGYTHIVGNMTNETDISATSVTLVGRLFDAGDNLIAETTAEVCPRSVQPHSQNVFDLRFPSPNLPAAARYEVRPIAGETVPDTLPSGNLVLVGMAAYRVTGTLQVSGSVRNDGAIAYEQLRYCSAAYDAAGKVIKFQASPISGVLAPGALVRVPVVWPDLPDTAKEVIVWVSVGPSAQWIATPRMAIQNSNPPH